MKDGKGVTWLDDGRIPYSNNQDFERRKRGKLISPPFGRNGIYGMMSSENKGIINTDQYLNESGRFPANLLVQDKIFSDELSKYFDLDMWYSKNIEELPDYVQRILPFLYVPKASTSERDENLENEPMQKWLNGGGGTGISDSENIKTKNIHPTVKPLKLMSYLITIGSRQGDTILDPFMGSGTTGVAAKILNRNFIGFELEEKYFEIAVQKINPIKKGILEFEVDE